LAGELEVRVRVVTAVAPAAPRPCFLLRDAEHHHPGPPLTLSRLHVRPGDILLHIALLKPHHRDRVRLGKPVELLNIGAADPPEDRRRGDRPTRPIFRNRTS